jgi:hypothetical protein
MKKELKKVSDQPREMVIQIIEYIGISEHQKNNPS